MSKSNSDIMSLKSAPYLSEISVANGDSGIGFDGGCADPYAPSRVPSRRWDYSTKWDMKITGAAREFNLSKQPVLTGLINSMRMKTSLTHPEIHVVWRGLVPPAVCRDDVVVTLRFTPDRSEKMGLIAQHTHGMHLYMHHVFYPSHSIRVGPGEPLPWAVGFSVPDFSLDPNYTIAEVHVRLTGYFSELPEYDIQRDSELISIVPMEEHVTGYATSAPRIPNTAWVARGYKIGVNGNSLAKKIKFLQEIGVDIEALRMVGQLDNTLKKVSPRAIDGSPSAEAKSEAARLVNAHVKTLTA